MLWHRIAIVLLSSIFSIGAVRLSDAQSPLPSVQATLGFADELAWNLTEGSGALDFVPGGTAGDSALLVGGSYWRRIASVNLANVSATSNTATVDVKVLQPAQSWETVGIVLQLPSRGIYWDDLGQVPLTQATTDQFTTFTFLLPESTRSLIHQGGYDDLRVLLSVNSSASVVVDSISFGLPDQGAGDGGGGVLSTFAGGTTLAPYRSGSAGSACEANPLNLVDVRSDYRDIWLGSETPQGGKRVDPEGRVVLEFDQTIDPETVYAWYEPLQACGPWVRVGVAPTSNSWSMSAAGFPNVEFPADFNAFVRQSILGTPDSRGPMAAGGAVKLSSFSVNLTSGQPVGLIVGGSPDLRDGTLLGDVWTSKPYELPGTVTQSNGTRSTRSIDFTEAFGALDAFSQHLATFDQTGASSSNYGTVTFAGSESGLNVFYITSDLLRTANTINVQLPSGATGLVNVLGNEVVVENLGLTLTGVTRNRLLWNLPDARSVRVRGVSFQGSLLSPRGTVQFDNGNLEGTVVAQTLQGSGELHYFPFEAELAFPDSSTSVIAMFPEQALEPDCNYRFRLMAAGDADACLPEGVAVTFWTAEHESHHWNRELTNRTIDTDTGSVTRLEVAEGISTSVEDAWDRYGFGLASSDLIQEGPTVPAAVMATRDRTFFRQYHQGLPVRGAGYFVESESGSVRAALGTSVVGLPDLPQPSISGTDAVDLALAFLSVGVPPWLSDPDLVPPTVKEVVVATGNGQDARTVLEIDFKGAGVGDIVSVDVESHDGTISRVISGTSNVLPPDSSYLSSGTNQVVMPTVHGTADIPISLYDDGASGVIRRLTTAPLGQNGKTFVVLVDPGDENLAFDTNDDLLWDSMDGRSGTAAIFYWAALGTREFLETPGWAFGPTLWNGIGGLGDANLSLDYFDDPTKGSNAGLPAGGTWDPENPDSLLHINYINGFNGVEALLAPEATAHEIAHAVFLAARLRTGLSTLTNLRESGAINEGIADLLASAVKREIFTADVAWYTINMLPDFRNLLNPPESGMPDSILGPNFVDYSSIPDSECMNHDRCGVHENSTIVGHWGTILAAGKQAGSGSAGTCGIGVDPLTGEIGSSQHRVIQIILDSVQNLSEEADFESFRDATYFYSTQRYSNDPTTSERVAAAWYSVGLGFVGDVTPLDGATQIEPWDADLSFKAFSDEAFTVRIATDGNFQNVVDTVAVPAGSMGSDGRIHVSVELAPNTKYYWEVVPGESPDPELWTSCGFGSRSFTTKAKAVSLAVPKTIENGVRITDVVGQIRWYDVIGADSYALYLHSESQEDGCTGPSQIRSLVPNTAYVGNNFDVDSASPHYQRFSSYTILGEEFVAPNTDYHLYIQPLSGSQKGACTEFVIRSPGLGSFARLSPIRPHESGFPKTAEYVGLELANPQPRQSFRFTESAGAEAYRLRVYLYEDEEREYEFSLPIYDSMRPAGSCALKSPNPGELEWSFDIGEGTDCDLDEADFFEWSQGNALAWRVDALRGDMARRAATDAVSHAPTFYYQTDYLVSSQVSPWSLRGFYIRLPLESQGLYHADDSGQPISGTNAKLRSDVVSIGGTLGEAFVETYGTDPYFDVHDILSPDFKIIKLEVDGAIPYATSYTYVINDAFGSVQGVMDVDGGPDVFSLFASPLDSEVHFIIWPRNGNTLARVPTEIRVFTNWQTTDDPDEIPPGEPGGPPCWEENERPSALVPVGIPRLTSLKLPLGTFFNLEIAGQVVPMSLPLNSALEPYRQSGVVPTYLGNRIGVTPQTQEEGTAGYNAYISANNVDLDSLPTSFEVDDDVGLSGGTEFTASELPATPLNGYSYHLVAIVPRDACGQLGIVEADSIGIAAMKRD